MTGRKPYQLDDPVFLESFWARVDKSPASGCWHWTGRLDRGYGTLNFSYRKTRAHRISYLLAYGSVAEGMVLDHLCRNRKCVNPDHLEAVSNKENILRGQAPSAQNKLKTHCKRGHELSGDNLIVAKGGKIRACRACKAAWAREKRAANGVKTRVFSAPRFGHDTKIALGRKARGEL